MYALAGAKVLSFLEEKSVYLRWRGSTSNTRFFHQIKYIRK